MITTPRNILVSYHYFKGYNLDRFVGLRVIGDSGAFSAHSQGAVITTPELAAWAKQWAHRLRWVAALDVIGDAEATRRNWHEMVDLHGVPGVPTIHFGSDPALMDYYAGRGVDFIGLGGMVGRSAAAQMRWLVAVFKYARAKHPAVRFHGWGLTHAKALQLPFFSVDSSGWNAPQRFGRITLRDPHSMADYAIELDGRSTYMPKVAHLLRAHYGVNPDQVATSGPANYDVVVRLAGLSASVQDQRFQRLHRPGIPAPRWYSPDDDPGPYLHIASTSSYDLARVTDASLTTSSNGDRP